MALIYKYLKSIFSRLFFTNSNINFFHIYNINFAKIKQIISRIIFLVFFSILVLSLGDLLFFLLQGDVIYNYKYVGGNIFSGIYNYFSSLFLKKTIDEKQDIKFKDVRIPPFKFDEVKDPESFFTRCLNAVKNFFKYTSSSKEPLKVDVCLKYKNLREIFIYWNLITSQTVQNIDDPLLKSNMKSILSHFDLTTQNITKFHHINYLSKFSIDELKQIYLKNQLLNKNLSLKLKLPSYSEIGKIARIEYKEPHAQMRRNNFDIFSCEQLVRIKFKSILIYREKCLKDSMNIKLNHSKYVDSTLRDFIRAESSPEESLALTPKYFKYYDLMNNPFLLKALDDSYHNLKLQKAKAFPLFTLSTEDMLKIIHQVNYVKVKETDSSFHDGEELNRRAEEDIELLTKIKNVPYDSMGFSLLNDSNKFHDEVEKYDNIFLFGENYSKEKINEILERFDSNNLTLKSPNVKLNTLFLNPMAVDLNTMDQTKLNFILNFYHLFSSKANSYNDLETDIKKLDSLYFKIFKLTKNSYLLGRQFELVDIGSILSLYEKNGLKKNGLFSLWHKFIYVEFQLFYYTKKD